VRIRKPPQNGSRAVVSGAIATLDTTARTFVIGGQRVDYGAARLDPTVPANGQYVRVRGQLAADGTLVAEEVVLRNGRGHAEVQLRGNLSDLAGGTFTIRDVVVDASGITPERCAGGLAEGAFVEVEGRLSGNTVIATRVQCEDEPAGGTVEREGTAGSVSTTARTFVLGTSSGPVTVAWTEATFFRDVTADTLDGAQVQVEGVLNGGVLQARKIKLHRRGGGG
jgi:RNase P/RNase MRP subunit p29